MFAAGCHPLPPWALFFMGRGRWGRPGGEGQGHGGPPPWVSELFGHSGQRAERGEVRYLILDAVAEQPRHGYEIIQVIEERSKGAYKPSPGTVYPTLQMLEEMGHVTSREEAGRRIYTITEQGRVELEAHRDEVEDAYQRLGGPEDWFDNAELRELFHRFRRLMRGLGRTIRHHGLGQRQLREVMAIVEDAIQRIERVLDPERGQKA